jgi:hypothetical protein
MSDAIMPDLSQHVFSARTQIRDSKPEKEALKREQALHSLKNSLGWENGLKPYLEARMEALNKMSHLELKGDEPMEELGARFVMCNTVGEEIQDIIAIVEATADVVEKQNVEKDTGKSTT